ncbi:hypothetical protein FOZ60_002594 [Perkinsus olseni]|uniref:Uncharacterized protein n=1 Tax=Perkinsus olseni TaxID=32597 RepID=A0A7J6NXN4_PEROL|nr:hypothetical protein FOZ60_002594 [Perkinsus olseni]
MPLQFRNTITELCSELMVLRTTTSAALQGRRGSTTNNKQDTIKLADLRSRIQDTLLTTVESIVRNGTVRRSTLKESIADHTRGVTSDGMLIDDTTGIGWIKPFLYGSDVYGLPTGNELHSALLQLFLFCIVFRYTDSPVSGVIVAYLFSFFFDSIWSFVSRRTISRTSMVDDRFLL